MSRSESVRPVVIGSLLGIAVLGTASCRPSETRETGAAPQAEVSAAPPIYAWVQYGVGGLEARAIVAAGSPCPQATVDGMATPMSERAAAGGDFAVVSCQAAVPAGTASVSVAGTALPTPTGSPRRILVLGDTGCRIKGDWQENCDGQGTGTSWSFPEAARKAAAEAPDLIVHVGDYVYRESACDADKQPGCAGSPWGDKWDTWNTDFFAPAGPLLEAAPWIVTRGNHEDCGRNHLGWLRFLDGRPLQPAELQPDGCPQFSEPYEVAFDDADFLVLNTATDPTTSGLDPSAQDRYTAEFSRAAAMVTPGRSAWTVTHRPFWALAPEWQGDDQPAKLEVTDTTLQASIAAMPGGGWPPEVDMALAGHVHLLETLSFPDGRPHQVVSGDAGTSQDSPITPQMIQQNPQVFTQLGITPADFNSYHDFGYVLLDRVETGWTVTVKDLAGDVLEQFHLEG